MILLCLAYFFIRVEDPRQAEWTSLPQDPREAPEDKLAAATTSGAGLAKSQFKVFDPGGGV
jgi:hypothetical protein